MATGGGKALAASSGLVETTVSGRTAVGAEGDRLPPVAHAASAIAPTVAILHILAWLQLQGGMSVPVMIGARLRHAPARCRCPLSFRRGEFPSLDSRSPSVAEALTLMSR